jgi:hypothetical protein
MRHESGGRRTSCTCRRHPFRRRSRSFAGLGTRATSENGSRHDSSYSRCRRDRGLPTQSIHDAKGEGSLSLIRRSSGTKHGSLSHQPAASHLPSKIAPASTRNVSRRDRAKSDRVSPLSFHSKWAVANGRDTYNGEVPASPEGQFRRSEGHRGSVTWCRLARNSATLGHFTSVCASTHIERPNPQPMSFRRGRSVRANLDRPALLPGKRWHILVSGGPSYFRPNID